MVLWVFAVLCRASAASATSSPFRANEILNHAANPDAFVVRSDSWGLIHSEDAGRTWQWSCSDVFGGNTLGVEHPAMTLTPSGRLLVAQGFRGLFFTDDFCTWTRGTGLDELLVADVALAGDDILAVTSTGAEDAIENRLWVSSDGGAHFTPVPGDLPGDIALSTLAVASYDPSRVYAMGLAMNTGEGVLLRSRDGGRTFQRLGAPSLPSTRLTLRIAAIHPLDPDIVFEWIDVPENLSEGVFDELWVTGDGGESWSKVFTGKADLPGFAISPDASTLAIAGTQDGVYRGPLSKVLAGDPDALVQVNPRATWDLLWTADGLYGGNDNFALRGAPEPYTLGLSRDEGKTFAEITNICEFRFTACAAGTQGHDLCQELWDGPDPYSYERTFFQSTGRCEASAPDGGNSASERIEGGCGCTLTAPQSNHGAPLAIAVGIGFLAKKRRRERTAAPSIRRAPTTRRR